jgi:hypothetical protein
MKNIFKYKIQGLALLLMMASLVLLPACDDDESGSDEVVLLSFGPTGVQHGDEITFFGENLDEVTSIVFSPSVEVSKSSFTSVSSNRFNVVVPENAEAGTVILKTADGDITSKTLLSFEVPVAISTITAQAKPGTNITITGTKVNWIETVTFPSDIIVEKKDFVSVSLTEVVVKVPMNAQTGYLKFATGGTEPLTFDSEEQLIVTLPVVTNVSPSSIKHAANLTLTGTDLDLVTEINFKTTSQEGVTVAAGNFVSKTTTQIVVAVPITTTGGTLTLTVPSGVKVVTSGAISIILPVATAFSPSSTDDHDPGATLTITGTALDLVKEIQFPGVATPVTSFVSQSATEIQVVIPAGAQGGSVSFKTIHDFGVAIALPFGNQLQLTKPLYDDGSKNGFGQWGGYGGTTTVWNSTEQIRLGSQAIKATFPAANYQGAAQLGGGSLSTAGTANFAFSVYGGPGTAGKTLQVLVKINGGGEPTKAVTIVEGAWADFSVPLSELGNATTITELFFQNADFSGVVYIDHIGLK